MNLLAIDPSLTATGLVLLDDDLSVVSAICVRTRPADKGRRLYQADADGERVDEIARALDRAIARATRPLVVACEAPAGAQHAASAKALGLVYGCVRGVLAAHGLTPLMCQAFDAKKAAAGSRSASKLDVEAAMRQRWPGAFASGIAKPVAEAIADALAVACVALEHPMVRSMRTEAA